jgi:hypothetical protein
MMEVSWAPEMQEDTIQSPASSSAEVQAPALVEDHAKSIRLRYEQHLDPKEIIANEYALLKLFADLATAKPDAIEYINSDRNAENLFHFAFNATEEDRTRAVLIDRKMYVFRNAISRFADSDRLLQARSCHLVQSGLFWRDTNQIGPQYCSIRFCPRLVARIHPRPDLQHFHS